MVISNLVLDSSLHLFRPQGDSPDLNPWAPQNTESADMLCKQADSVKRNPEPVKSLEIIRTSHVMV